MTLTYDYNSMLDRTSMTDSLGSVGMTAYQYDNAHRLTTLTRSLGDGWLGQSVFAMPRNVSL